MKIKKLFMLILASVLVVSCATTPASHYFGNYSEAEKHYKQGDYEEAIRYYGRYIEENPDGNLSVIARFYVAKSHAELGHTDEAKEGFQYIAENYPDLPWAEFSKDQLKAL